MKTSLRKTLLGLYRKRMQPQLVVLILGMSHAELLEVRSHESPYKLGESSREVSHSTSQVGKEKDR